MTLRLLSAEIVDFRAYRGRHVLNLDMSPGVYFVRGVNREATQLESNDSGKSTLWNAVAWCLYGKLLDDERPAASIVPWQAVGSDSSEKPGTAVSLTFQRGDAFLRVLRAREPSFLGIARGRSLTEVVNAEVSECDQSIIDSNIKLSFRAFCCTIILPQFGDLFLDLPSEDQAKLLSDVLELDVWLRAADKASQLEKDTRIDLANIDNKISAAQMAVSISNEQIAATKKQSDSFESDKKKWIADLLAQADQEETALNRIDTLLEHTTFDEKPLADKEAALKQSNELLIAINASVSQKQADVYEKKAKATSTYERLNALKKYNGNVCPECEQPVSIQHVHKLLKRAEVDFAEQDKLHKQSVASLAESVKALTTARNDGQRIRDEISALQKLKHETVATISSLNIQRMGCSTQFNSLLDRIEVAQNEANPFAVSLSTARATLKQREAERAEAMQAKKQVSAEAEHYGFWNDGFRQCRLDLIDQCLAALQVCANAEAEALGLIGWRIEFKTEREAKSGNVSRKMTVVIYPPGQAAIKWKSFGGGVRQRWQLAVRFALSEMLLSFAGIEPNIEILDEPSVHMAQSGVDALLVLLKQRSQRLKRQCWIVEHHPLDESLFDGVIVVEHDAAGSRIVQ